MTIQGTLSIEGYFLKVKNPCSEISELDKEEPVKDSRLRRYLIRGLRKEFMPFISSNLGWATQPTIIELKNLLSNQEALTKQSTNLNNHEFKENVLYFKEQRRSSFSKHPTCDRKHFANEEKQMSSFRACYKCGKSGHIKRDCRVKVTCDRCEKHGHIRTNCRVKLQEAGANVVHESNVSEQANWEKGC